MDEPVYVCPYLAPRQGRFLFTSLMQSQWGFIGEGVFPDTARRRPYEEEHACNVWEIMKFGSSKYHWCNSLRLLVPFCRIMLQRYLKPERGDGNARTSCEAPLRGSRRGYMQKKLAGGQTDRPSHTLSLLLMYAQRDDYFPSLTLGGGYISFVGV